MQILIENSRPVQVTVMQESETSVWVILFIPPKLNSFRYFTIKPLILDLRLKESDWEAKDVGEALMMKELMSKAYMTQYPDEGTKPVDDLDLCLKKVFTN